MNTEADQLVQNARRGDRAAVEALIGLFYEQIYAFLRRLSGNDADAADLTQQTFKKVWKSLPSFAGRSSLGSWIHSIAYHTHIDWVRANHRTESRSPEWWAVRESEEARPDEMAAHRDRDARLYALVDRLPPELRDSIHLHYYQELSLQETADAMGVATSTVKYRLRQALVELEEKISSERPALSLPVPTKQI